MSGDDDGLADHLTDLAAPILDAHGVELVDMEIRGYTGSRVVCLHVDVVGDGGIDVDTCAAVSQDVEAVFDDEDAVPGSYTLRVTSPGVDRPLKTSRDFVRHLGRDVVIAAHVREDGEHTARSQTTGSQTTASQTTASTEEAEAGADSIEEIAGVVDDVREGDVILDVDGESVAVALEDVDHGEVRLPW